MCTSWQFKNILSVIIFFLFSFDCLLSPYCLINVKAVKLLPTNFLHIPFARFIILIGWD